LAVCLVSLAQGSVTINGRNLQVNGQNYFVKGVNYDPVPIGQNPGQTDYFSNSQIFNRDIPVIQRLGANTLRIYGVGNPGIGSLYQDFLDACINNGIRVVFAYYVPTSSNFADAGTRSSLVSGFVDMVNQFKNHPAILMWMFGNELNFNSAALPDLFSLINEARNAAHSAEGSSWHPVCASMADINLISTIAQYDSSVDLWALQIYRGSSFYTLFSDYAKTSSKPMVITEFGIDSWSNSANGVDEATQSQVDAGLFKEIINNRGVCSGGLVFEFQDEWWKAGNINSHDSNSSPCNSPDGACSAEYYGICAISPGTPNGLTPRQAYYGLQSVFASA